jgi:hypothetical protein
MYGLVNKAIKDLVVSNHGEEKWKEICRLTGHLEEDFIGMNPYPDKLTYDLVGNASKVLGADPHDLLEAFGEYWILYTADEGYGDLMDLTGSTFTEFLGNLDMLHYRINNIMPELSAPQFSVRNEQEHSIELEYRTHREGLSPMLLGLIKGLGKRFGLDVRIRQIQVKDDTNDCHVFLIEWN